MSWWDWVTDFERRVRQAGDADRMRLVSLLYQASSCRELDPGRFQALCAEDPRHLSAVHYSTYVDAALCGFHFARGEWPKLGEVAGRAEEASRKVGNRVELSEAYLWQAVLAFHDGDEQRGRRLRQRG